MNQKQENKNSSFLGLEDHLEKNSSVTATLPPLTGIVAEIKAERIKIDDLIAKQGTTKGGVAGDKAKSAVSLIDAVVDASNRLVAYATIAEKPQLVREATVTQSGLQRLADTKLKGVAQGIYDLAIANAIEALTFGITPALTGKLQACITDYSAAITQPKLSIDEIKQITTGLDMSFKQLEALFKKVDKLIKLFKDSHTVFHDSYFNLRKVIIYGKGTLAMQILVRDAETGAGLPKVKFLIEKVDADGKKLAKGADLVKNVKISSAKGGSKLKTLSDGNYTLTASRTDYVPQLINFSIVGGIMTNVVIDMVKA